jgi:hypothetical protein
MRFKLPLRLRVTVESALDAPAPREKGNVSRAERLIRVSFGRTASAIGKTNFTSSSTGRPRVADWSGRMSTKLSVEKAGTYFIPIARFERRPRMRPVLPDRRTIL